MLEQRYAHIIVAFSNIYSNALDSESLFVEFTSFRVAECEGAPSVQVTSLVVLLWSRLRRLKPPPCMREMYQ